MPCVEPTIPQWFWRSTFRAARNYYRNLWKMGSFDDVFAHTISQKRPARPLSPVNLIAHYAATHESHRYHLMLDTGPSSEAAATVASNRCIPRAVQLGCCHSFGVGCRPGDAGNIHLALLKYGRSQTSWRTNAALSTRHYQTSRAAIAARPKATQDRMASACSAAVQGPEKVTACKAQGKQRVTNCIQSRRNYARQLLAVRPTCVHIDARPTSGRNKAEATP